MYKRIESVLCSEYGANCQNAENTAGPTNALSLPIYFGFGNSKS
jgi:hypothetical protein